MDMYESFYCLGSGSSSLLAAFLSLLLLFGFGERIDHQPFAWPWILFVAWNAFEIFWYHHGPLQDGHTHRTAVLRQLFLDLVHFNHVLESCLSSSCSCKHLQAVWDLKVSASDSFLPLRRLLLRNRLPIFT